MLGPSRIVDICWLIGARPCSVRWGVISGGSGPLSRPSRSRQFRSQQ